MRSYRVLKSLQRSVSACKAILGLFHGELVAEQARQDQFVCLVFRVSVEFILERKCGGKELFRLVVAIMKSLRREQAGIRLGLKIIVPSVEMTYSDFAKRNLNSFSAICEPLQEVFPYIESEIQAHHLRQVASFFGGVMLQIGGETARQFKAAGWYNKRLHDEME